MSSYDSSRETAMSPIPATRRSVTPIYERQQRDIRVPITPKISAPSVAPTFEVTPDIQRSAMRQSYAPPRPVSPRATSYYDSGRAHTGYSTLSTESQLAPRSASPLTERPVTPIASDSLRTAREIRIVDRMSSRERSASPSVPSLSKQTYFGSERGQRDYGLSSKRSAPSTYSRPERKDYSSSSYTSSARSYDTYEPRGSYRQRSSSPQTGSTRRRSVSPPTRRPDIEDRELYSSSSRRSYRESYEPSRTTRQRSPSPKVITTDYDRDYASASKTYDTDRSFRSAPSTSRLSPTTAEDWYDRSLESDYKTSAHKSSSRLGAFAPVGTAKPGSVPRADLPFKLDADLLEESGSDHSSPARFIPLADEGDDEAIFLEKQEEAKDKTEDQTAKGGELPEPVKLTKEEAQLEEKEKDIGEEKEEEEKDEDSERLIAKRKEAMIETDQKIDDTEGDGPPEFVRRMCDMTVNDGARVVLEVQITGARPMDVGWLRNGQDIPDSDEFRYISRGNVYQLVIAEIFPEDSGKYTCEALNDHGEADCQCALNVIEEPSVSISINMSQDITSATTTDHQAIMDDENIPPEFFEEPQSQTVEEGGMARFVCDVDGEPIPTVTWSKDDAPIRDGGRFRVYSDKFSHTFEIPVALATDEGEYVCTATNKEGQTECGFSLRVIHDQTSTVVDKQTIDETEQQSAPPDTSPEPIAIIAPVAQSASGPDHDSEVIAQFEDITEPIDEPVRFSADSEAPVFVEELTDQVVAEECGTTLQCRATGKPLPDITWYFEDRPIRSSKFFQMSEEDDLCMLIIAEAYTEDAGKYSCHANNEAGDAVTSAMLIVKEAEPTPITPAPAAETINQQAPSFDKKIQDCEVQANSEAKFESIVHGMPTPETKWFKNGKPLKEGIRHKMSSGADGECTLVIPRAQMEDSGEYECRAVNANGTASCTAKLNLKTAKKLPFLNKFQQDGASPGGGPGGKGPGKKGPGGPSRGGSSVMARAQMFGK